MTSLFIFIAIICAAIASYYQYFYKCKNSSKVTISLFILRFLSIFLIALLLINPVISTKTFEITKPALAIVIDNSRSVSILKSDKITSNLIQILQNNTALISKFNILKYQFDINFAVSDNLTFNGNQSNIDNVGRSLKNIYRNKKFPTILLTDGNQTIGSDYLYSFDDTNKVFPLILGDTISFLDLKINQVNVNKYAFRKNKFPVETFLQYNGKKPINAIFTISQGNNIFSKQEIKFSNINKTATINTLLPANAIGQQIYKATISSAESEKNTYNNVKNFSVNIIDERSTVAIVSAINHPDIGALKRSIETNSQRKVKLLKPSDVNEISTCNVVILYQPTVEFESIVDKLQIMNKNTLIITGLSTNYTFLNKIQSDFSFKMSAQAENYTPNFQTNFNYFTVDDLGFEQFPPLQNLYGTINASTQSSILLTSMIRNIDTKSPLLAFAENKGSRHAYLFGENSWKWRLKWHIENNNFEKYDIFIDKTIQYLASNSNKKSLEVTHENFYNSGDDIEISAQYFNKNYEFDDKAQLTIMVKNKKTGQSKNYDLLKSANNFKVNLSGLATGKYSFTVKELNSKTSYSNEFSILDFDIEKQFINANILQLKQLASQTKGEVFMPNQIQNLIKTLTDDKNYTSIETEIVKKTPLIEWKWLLIFIAISLAIEWFVRKYNGLS